MGYFSYTPPFLCPPVKGVKEVKDPRGHHILFYSISYLEESASSQNKYFNKRDEFQSVEDNRVNS